jgi:hypothetical protein
VQTVEALCKHMLDKPYTRNVAVFFCNKTTIESEKSKADAPTQEQCMLRSGKSSFNFEEHCLLCGQTASNDGNIRENWRTTHVLTTDFQDSVVQVCTDRNDDWSHAVKSRIEYVQDLRAADTVYHRQCCINFRTRKQQPQPYHKRSKPNERGRPEDEDKVAAFIKVTKYLEENDEEQTTIGDLVNKSFYNIQDPRHIARNT